MMIPHQTQGHPSNKLGLTNMGSTVFWTVLAATALLSPVLSLSHVLSLSLVCETWRAKPERLQRAGERAICTKLVWIKIGKWKHGLKPAVPWWFNFDPYPNSSSHSASLSTKVINGNRHKRGKNHPTGGFEQGQSISVRNQSANSE